MAWVASVAAVGAPRVSVVEKSPCPLRSALERVAPHLLVEGSGGDIAEWSGPPFVVSLRRDGQLVLSREFPSLECEVAAQAAALVLERHLEALPVIEPPPPPSAPPSPWRIAVSLRGGVWLGPGVAAVGGAAFDVWWRRRAFISLHAVGATPSASPVEVNGLLRGHYAAVPLLASLEGGACLGASVKGCLAAGVALRAALTWASGALLYHSKLVPFFDVGPVAELSGWLERGRWGFGVWAKGAVYVLRRQAMVEGATAYQPISNLEALFGLGVRWHSTQGI